MMKTTKTIAGHEITLTRGERYVAGRPMASDSQNAFPVSIHNVTAGWSGDAERTLPAMTYDEANDFLAAFNKPSETYRWN